MLFIFSSPPFYTRYVKLPAEGDPVPPEISENPRFYPYFEDAVGAMDGVQVDAAVSAEDLDNARNRKGGVTQNVLAACSFDMRFQYVLSGWEGSVTDAALYTEARRTSLHALPGKFWFADAGFSLCDALLVPYRGVRYHLAEWRRADLR